MKHKLSTTLLVICLFLLVISASIAAPILIRPFYYSQIGPLGLEKSSDYTYEQICTAYHDVMDFLVIGAPFKTGELGYSESGKAHFEDCRGLFVLDFWVLGICAALCVILWLLRRQNPATHTARHTPAFFSAIASYIVFAALGIWGALDFNSLFVAFHTAFFPGKTNWLFDPAVDEIINILPERFFMNCALLIVALIWVCNAAFLIYDDIRHKKLARR